MRVTRLLLLGPFYTIQTKRDQTFFTRVYYKHKSSLGCIQFRAAPRTKLVGRQALVGTRALTYAMLHQEHNIFSSCTAAMRIVYGYWLISS